MDSVNNCEIDNTDMICRAPIYHVESLYIFSETHGRFSWAKEFPSMIWLSKLPNNLNIKYINFTNSLRATHSHDGPKAKKNWKQSHALSPS